MEALSEKKFLFLLFIFTSISLFSQLDVFEANLMEARNFVTAREMLADGHWWETTMNGLPRLEKPPLPTWITAIFGSLSGNFSLWSLRFPAAIMGLLLVFWTYALAKALLNDIEKARWSALVCASSLLFIQMSKTGTWDIYFVSLAVGSFMHLSRELILKQGIWLNSLAAGLLLGFSILSKGPVTGIMLVAFLLALTQLLGFRAMLMEWKCFALVALIAASIGFSWPLYNFVYLPEATEAVVAKESIIWTTKHVKPFYFYLILPVYMGVWAIPSLLSLFPKLAQKQVGKSYFSLLVWLGVTLFFFSLLPMKKERYLLPAIPVLAILTGSFLAQIINSAPKNYQKKIFWPSFGILAMGLTASPVFLLLLQEKLAYALSPISFIGIALLCITGLFMFWMLTKAKNREVLLISALVVLLVNVFLLPTLAEVHYKQPNYISPDKLMENPELQNKTLYGNEEADMRVVHDLKSKLLPISKATESLKKDSIYLLIPQNINFVKEQFPNARVEKIDSSGHHKTARNYGLNAYKIFFLHSAK